MRINTKLIAGGALLALMSGTALAHSDIHFGLSIGIPAVPVYAAPAPSYYPAPGYYSAPPASYDPPPPPAYYSAPAPAYYGSAPGFSVYYGPSYRQYRERRDWHHYRDRDHEDDDDD
ncbi:MAG TPA: hypothetical protein VKP89_02810 [Burkholderiales bacterium]|nr:hypothetical protein [Burkholderiales bacterium]